MTGRKNCALQVPPVVPYKAQGRFPKALYMLYRTKCVLSCSVDRGSAVIFDADSGLCLSYVRILGGPKRNLDHRSFFSLDRYVNEFIQIISKEVHLNSSVRLLSESVDCVRLSSSMPSSLLYLGEINNGIHMYQFTFGPLNFCFRMCLNKNFGGSTDLAKKKRHGSTDLHTPIHPPPPPPYTNNLSS